MFAPFTPGVAYYIPSTVSPSLAISLRSSLKLKPSRISFFAFARLGHSFLHLLSTRPFLPSPSFDWAIPSFALDSGYHERPGPGRIPIRRKDHASCCGCPCCKPEKEISVEMGKDFVRKVWFSRERYIAYLSQKFNKSSTDAEDEWMYLRVFSRS